jgi:hypothetical protein
VNEQGWLDNAGKTSMEIPENSIFGCNQIADND